MNIGENIKKLRELKNITREKMTCELNMSLSNYSKIERGEIDLSVSRLQNIANALDVEISSILNFDTTEIFNIHKNKMIHGSVTKAEQIHYHSVDYKEKYIKILEEEVERLKEENQILKKKS
jgi:transcriptional regulator with XRE-family HTH domain